MHKHLSVHVGAHEERGALGGGRVRARSIVKQVILQDLSCCTGHLASFFKLGIPSSSAFSPNPSLKEKRKWESERLISGRSEDRKRTRRDKTLLQQHLSLWPQSLCRPVPVRDVSDQQSGLGSGSGNHRVGSDRPKKLL